MPGCHFDTPAFLSLSNSYMKKQVMDGCTAAAYSAFAMSDVATIYPITPIASMGETAQKWTLQGRKNLMGRGLDVREMESELGAAGATHGALAGGALATTFTSSQGLMLMIPNMFKIAGELLPGVFHVGTRSLATHALSIFGDHQDVMACRTTGFAFLASANVQETLDLGLVAHLAAIDGRVPVVHFFDGWRTSNEFATIEPIPYESMKPLVNWDNVKAFYDRSMNPAHPDLRGSAQNPDVYFQNAEAANGYYDAFPGIVQDAMDRVGNLTGRHYKLFDYHGDPEATEVMVKMGSGAEVAKATSDFLNSQGAKTGVVTVRLFRPFSAERLLGAIPASAGKIAVMDRTKEPGSQGEPLLMDVAMAFQQARRNATIIGGRYGLSSKEFSPAMVKAIFDELKKDEPRRRFTIGINDDLTHLSLSYDSSFDIAGDNGVCRCIFYGIGADGMVGATKQIANILTGNGGYETQAYFHYSAKKSGGYTISELRFAKDSFNEEYGIAKADIVMCSKSNYVNRFKMADKVKKGGIFILNSPCKDADSLSKALPAEMKRAIASGGLRLFTIDATAIAQQEGLGQRTNIAMMTAFLKLCASIDYDSAIAEYKKQVTDTYSHEGMEVVAKNMRAIDAAAGSVAAIDYPAGWSDASDPDLLKPEDKKPEFVVRIAEVCDRLEGDSLPVSVFRADGVLPLGSTAYEKRRIAVNVPEWNPDKCIQCALCSYVCPHAAIRPYLLDATEKAGAPGGMLSIAAKNPAFKDLDYRIQVYVEDCVGCGSCATVCPGHALTMVPLQSQLDSQIPLLDYCQQHVALKDDLLPPASVIGTQLQQPLLQFSGACGGCGETPYVKLLTQLFGDRLVIANATGCSSIWGANYPSVAYCTDKNGRGPAWGNSLFEDNAEYAYGIKAAFDARKDELAAENPKPISVWAVGGDGWAYDIGFAGLDHVLASGENINILVMDTECYSNTGGQTSKATPISAVTKYSPDGKRTFKKDLGRMMMSYGTVYVASIAMGANYQQTIDALREAEAFDGPSIVIAYCPCINHGIRTGMSHAMIEERNAVKSGYWQLYRYNPALAAQGKNPLTVDYPAPDTADMGTLLLDNEDRYADLKMIDPAEAAKLQPMLAERCSEIYKDLKAQ